MEDLLVLQGLFTLLTWIVQVILLIVFLVMAWNVARIQKQCDTIMRSVLLNIKHENKKYCPKCKQTFPYIFTSCPHCFNSMDIRNDENSVWLVNKKSPDDNYVTERAYVERFPERHVDYDIRSINDKL